MNRVHYFIFDLNEYLSDFKEQLLSVLLLEQSDFDNVIDFDYQLIELFDVALHSPADFNNENLGVFDDLYGLCNHPDLYGQVDECLMHFKYHVREVIVSELNKELRNIKAKTILQKYEEGMYFLGVEYNAKLSRNQNR